MTTESSSPLIERILHYAAIVGFVVAVLLGGWLATTLARRLVRVLVQRSGLEAFAERAGISKLLYAIGVKQGLSAFLGGVVYVGGWALTLSAASDIAGLSVVSTAATSVLRYLPRLLTAGGLLLGAFVAASIVRGFVERIAVRNGSVRSPKGAANVVYTLVLAVGCMLAAEQAGIAVALLTTLLQISVAIIGLGLALTFALGFHLVFRNLAAGHYYKPLLRVGNRVRIGDDEGTVVRFAPTVVVLRTEGGELLVPCSRFLYTTVHILADAAVPVAPSAVVASASPPSSRQ